MNIKITLPFFLLFYAAASIAQTTYNMGTINGQTINTCSGTFVDAGGVNGQYGPNLNQTVTFCSGGGTNPTHIQINFGLFEISDDQICFYDGPNTSAPQITCLGGTGQQPPSGPFLVRASAANTSGCITISFTSNGSGQANGWSGTISCVASCQPIFSELLSSTPAVNPSPNGYIDICKGQTVSFSGTGVYPQNGVIYNHSNANCTFDWDFGDGQTGVGINTTHTYNQAGGFFVQLNIHDQFNCPNINNLSQRIRVSGPPRFNGTGSSLGNICAGDTTPITAVVGNVTSQQQSFSVPLVSGDSLFLPDGVGTSYATSINVQSFSPGQTLTNINDLLGICVSMEHSYMGDLSIRIKCPPPSNTTVYLQGSAAGGAGGGRWLGTPCDVDALPNTRGVPGQYCWTPTATQTWVAGPTINVTEPCPPNTSSASLAPGNYASTNPLTALIGCPLNGQWTLTFVDNLAIDNGFLSSWGLNFASHLYPTVETFTPTVVNAQWTPDQSIISATGQNISISSNQAGIHYYTYSVTNNFGCTYDTTVTINVLAPNNVACRSCNGFAAATIRDTTICTGNAVTLDATATGGLGSIITTFNNDQKKVIPNGSSTNSPNSATAYLYSDVTVSDVVPNVIAAGSIDRVCINFTQSYDADLDVYLLSPTGTRIALTDDNGGSGQNYGTMTGGLPTSYTCFLPTATQSIIGQTAPFTNAAGYLPEGSFAAFNGQNPNGVWRLKYGDDSGSASVPSGASFNSWYISFRNSYSVAYNWTRSPNTGTFTTASGGAVGTATPVSTTTYTVTATDSYGCTDTETAIVTTGNSIPAPTVTCDAVTLTSVTFAWTSVSPTHQISIDNGVTWLTPSSGATGLTHTVTGLTAGQSVTILVRGIGNCPAITGTETCTPQGCNIGLTTPTLTQVSCFGGADGTANVPRTNGFAPFHWDLAGPVTATNQPTGTFLNLSAGNYSVTITDDGGCTATKTFIITEPPVLTVSSTTTQAACNNGSTGTATATPAGGTSPYTYAWLTPTPQSSQTATSLSAGVYVVTVTDSKSCFATTAASVSEPPSISLTLSMTQPTCNGSTNGSASVSTAGGVPNYTYRWSTIPQQTTATATNIAAGTYTVTVTDANLCSQIGTIIVTQLSTVNVGMQITPVTCNGAANGDINANPSGGNPPYTFSWSNGGSGISQSNLSANTYTVIVTDQSNCTASTLGVIIEPAVLQGVASQTDSVSCFGGTDGKVTVTVTGGTSPYTYNWGGGITTPQVTTFAAGIHTVTITDSHSCITIASINVTQPNALSATATEVSPVTCFGLANGIASVTPTGGTTPYHYAWSQTGVVGNNPNNLAAGSYTITVTDVNSCATSTTVTITEPQILTLTTTVIDSVSCFNGADGKATVVATGGTTPYSYSWDIPNTSSNPVNLTAGIHTVTVTDNKQCSKIATVTILQPVALSATAAQTDSVSCNNGNDGKACITATGGTTPYHYRWSDNSTNSCNNNLLAGTHFVTVTDVNGCSVTASVTILQPAILSVTVSQTDSVSCNAGSDGKALATVIGGTMPYNYRWDIAGISTPNPSTLPAGTHTVTVTDVNSCTTTGTVIISEPLLLLATATQTDSVSCNGGNDGKACVAPRGGTSPYHYIWDNGVTSLCNTTLNAGIHTVTVTDVNGCSIVTTVTILEPEVLAATASEVAQVTCFGRSDGQATVTTTGGTAPLHYLWDNTNTSASPLNLNSSTHTVLITDVNGCLATATVTIGTPPVLVLSASRVDSVSCNGGNDGKAIALATGGTPGYTYFWDNGFTGPNANNLSANTHTVIVTDSHSCTAVAAVIILEPLLLTATTQQTDSVSCNGGNDGKAIILSVGGTTPYRYIWNNGSNSQNPTNLTAGTHTCTVTDFNGCTTVATVAITEPTLLTATAQAIDSVSCMGGNDGKAEVIPLGGTAPYHYVWTGSTSTSSIATDLTAGTHTVTITDVNGCNATATVNILEPLLLSVTTTFSNANCFGSGGGSATAIPSGGTAPYRYAWGPPSNAQSSIAPNLGAGAYTVTVIDYSGCSASATAIIGEPTALQAILTPTNVACFDQYTGSISTTTTGSVPPYTYNWSDLTNQQTAVAIGLHAGTYTVTINDSHNCSIIVSATIIEASQLVATATSTNINCYGANNGTASVSVQGGTSPYTFNWSNNSQQPAISNLPAGTYTVTVTDGNLCSVITSVVVTEPSDIVLSIVKTDAICFGQSSGSATVTGTGGVPGYTYAWLGSTSTAPTLTSLSAGTYTAQVTDVNGCSKSISTTISQPMDIILTLSQQAVRCFGTPTGQATCIAGGGSIPYQYSWSTTPPQSASTAVGLTGGPVTVTVTDNSGCIKVEQIQVIEPEAITIEINAIATRCNGEATGSITATVSGGVTSTTGYGYYWSSTPQQTTQTAINLPAGIYTVTVNDANACIATATGTVQTISPITATTTTTPVSCFGGNNGTATVTADGGTGSNTLTFVWNTQPGAQTNSIALGLIAGTYSVTITDQQGCTLATSATVTQPDALVGSVLSISPIACKGICDGSATIAATGGTQPYQYQWLISTTDSTRATLANQCAGHYNCKIIDSNNCQTTIETTITEPQEHIQATTSATEAGCQGAATGTATVSVTGGTVTATTGYTFNWSDNQTTATAIGLTAGTYTVTVTDVNNCFTTASIIVRHPSALSVIFPTKTVPSCTGGNDASCTTAAAGGTPNYTYIWSTSPTQTGSIANGLHGSATYTVTATDINGCTGSASVSIGEPLPIVLTISNTPAGCFAGATGSATVNANGGEPTYYYTWSNSPSTAATATSLVAGVYNVTVTDQKGCTAATTTTILPASRIIVLAVPQGIMCFGEATGTANVIPAGGVAPFTYTWSNDPTNNSPFAQNLAAGTYTVTVNDANACPTTTQVVITQPPLLSVDGTATNAKCYGSYDGQINIQPHGGQAPYVYSYNGGITFSGNPILVGLKADQYLLAIHDANGCLAKDTVIINEPPQLLVDAGIDKSIEFGDNITINTNTVGGTGNINYVWTSTPIDSTCIPATTPNIIGNPKINTYYSVVVTDINGCTDKDQVLVNVTATRRVFVATAITPNSDNINDVLYVQGGRGTERVVYLRIYDRWGELIFEAKDTPINDPKFGWNGTYKDEKMDSNTFVWTAEVRYSDGQRQVLKGDVSVLR